VISIISSLTEGVFHILILSVLLIIVAHFCGIEFTVDWVMIVKIIDHTIYSPSGDDSTLKDGNEYKDYGCDDDFSDVTF